jgi:heptose-I-phosphate ethanolaminephosphotransferase
MFQSKTYKFGFIFFLCLLPWICFGLILNNWNFKLLCAYLASATIICAIYEIAPSKVLKKAWWLLCGIIVLTWSLTETLNVLQEKTIINDLAMKIFFESNPRELKEYFLSIIPKWVLIVVVFVIAAIIVFFLKFKHLQENSKHKKTAFISLISGIVILFALEGNYTFGIFTNIQSAATKLIAYYKSISKSEASIKEEIKGLQITYAKTKATYVLIIGESTSRHHLGMYGYWRNTTPLLSARKDLQFFTDVISSNTSTVECLGKYLTINANKDSIRNFGDVNILDIANSCNIKTYWLSNQNKDAIYKNSITEGTKSAQHKFFVQDVYAQANTRYDHLLMNQLRKALEDTASEKLICLHLMGTHFKFDDRYPASFQKFNSVKDVQEHSPLADNTPKVKSINAYDNANLYQDSFLNSVFNTLDAYKTSGNNVSAIYFSDHGEEVFDYRNFIGHNPQSNAAWLHEIPFALWNFTPNKNLNRPYQLSYFSNTLLQWLKIGTNSFEASSSILSDSVNIGTRYLGNGQLYVPSK